MRTAVVRQANATDAHVRGLAIRSRSNVFPEGAKGPVLQPRALQRRLGTEGEAAARCVARRCVFGKALTQSGEQHALARRISLGSTDRLPNVANEEGAELRHARLEASLAHEAIELHVRGIGE